MSCYLDALEAHLGWAAREASLRRCCANQEENARRGRCCEDGENILRQLRQGSASQVRRSGFIRREMGSLGLFT